MAGFNFDQFEEVKPVKVNKPQGQSFDFSQFEEVPQDSTTVVKGGVEENVFLDTAKGFAKGVSSLGEGIGRNIINPYVRPMIGKEPLSEEELDKAYFSEPTTQAGQAAKFVGDVAPALLLPETKVFQGASFLPKLGNMALTGGYQGAAIGAADNLKKGEFDPANIGVSAGMGAGIGSFLPVAGKAFEKTIGPVGSFLSGIPRESFDRALNAINQGRNLFGGKFDRLKSIDDIQSRLSQGFNRAERKAGELVNEQEQLLKEDLQPIDVQAIRRALSQYIEDKTGYQNHAFNGKDARAINDLKSELLNYENQGGAYPIDLHFLKQKLQDVLFQNKSKPALSQRGENALTTTEYNINSALRNNVDYANANDNYSQIADLAKKLKSVLDEDTGAGKLANANTEASQMRNLPKYLQEAENVMPEDIQFFSDLQDTLARQPFERWRPGRGGGSGGEEGYMNNIRAAFIGTGLSGGGIASLLTGNPLPFLGTIAAMKSFAPNTYKDLIRAYQSGQPVASFLPKGAVAGYNNFND